jgi:hypothetical protein
MAERYSRKIRRLNALKALLAFTAWRSRQKTAARRFFGRAKNVKYHFWRPFQTFFQKERRFSILNKASSFGDLNFGLFSLKY